MGSCATPANLGPDHAAEPPAETTDSGLFGASGTRDGAGRGSAERDGFGALKCCRNEMQPCGRRCALTKKPLRRAHRSSTTILGLCSLDKLASIVVACREAVGGRPARRA